MDYIPVYEGEDQGGSSVTVSLDKVQRSGVRTEEVRRVSMIRPVRAPAIAKPDERTLRVVSLRADAFIEKLYVNETGKHVKAGEPLFRIYSPQMVTAQINYQVSERARGSGAGGGGIEYEGAEQQLQNLELPPSSACSSAQHRRARDGDRLAIAGVGRSDGKASGRGADGAHGRRTHAHHRPCRASG